MVNSLKNVTSLVHECVILHAGCFFQAEVCASVLPSVLQTVVAGSDGCILCYGQPKTGSYQPPQPSTPPPHLLSSMNPTPFPLEQSHTNYLFFSWSKMVSWSHFLLMERTLPSFQRSLLLCKSSCSA